MSPENVSAILGGLTDGVVGAIFGFLSAYLIFRLTRKRKNIEYEISSMPLLRFTPNVNNTLQVSVDKSVLSGQASDKGINVQVENAYGFQIDLQNVGNDPITRPSIEISLDNNANILEYETQPISKPSYEIITQKDSLKPYIFHISAPFINDGEHILIRLISTGNKTRECTVNVIGLGIKVQRKTELKGSISILVSYTILSIALVILIAHSDHPLVSTYDWNWLITPLGIINISVILVSLCVLIMSFTSSSKSRRLRRNQQWDRPTLKSTKNKWGLFSRS